MDRRSFMTSVLLPAGFLAVTLGTANALPAVAPYGRQSWRVFSRCLIAVLTLTVNFADSVLREIRKCILF